MVIALLLVTAAWAASPSPAPLPSVSQNSTPAPASPSLAPLRVVPTAEEFKVAEAEVGAACRSKGLSASRGEVAYQVAQSLRTRLSEVSGQLREIMKQKAPDARRDEEIRVEAERKRTQDAQSLVGDLDDSVRVLSQFRKDLDEHRRRMREAWEESKRLYTENPKKHPAPEEAPARTAREVLLEQKVFDQERKVSEAHRQQELADSEKGTRAQKDSVTAIADREKRVQEFYRVRTLRIEELTRAQDRLELLSNRAFGCYNDAIGKVSDSDSGGDAGTAPGVAIQGSSTGQGPIRVQVNDGAAPQVPSYQNPTPTTTGLPLTPYAAPVGSGQ